MSRTELFAISKNGVKVMYDPIGSHASTHFRDTPQIVPFVKKIIEQTDVIEPEMGFNTDTGVLLGNSELVETDETDEIIYAIRKNRDTYMRFTKSRKSVPDSTITIVLRDVKDGNCNLYSAWLGPITPPTPDSPRENENSLPFWTSHALVWGTQEIIPGTEVSDELWRADLL